MIPSRNRRDHGKLKVNEDAESVPLDERVHPLHHDTSRAPEMVEVLRIRSASSTRQVQQVLVVPVVLVVQELPVDPRFSFETAIEVIDNTHTARRR